LLAVEYLEMRFCSNTLSIVLGIVLGISTISYTTTYAFLPSSTISIRHTTLSATDDIDKSLISQLAFYPSDEPLSERLKNVQETFDDTRKEGIGKFFSDEFEAANKIIKGNADSATSKANDVISKSIEDSDGDGDYLLREGFMKMSETGKALAHELWEVRQEFDELKAAKIVEEAAEDVVSTDVLIEKGEWIYVFMCV